MVTRSESLSSAPHILEETLRFSGQIRRSFVMPDLPTVAFYVIAVLLVG